METPETSLTENSLKCLQRRLETRGYKDSFTVESISLISTLLNDLEECRGELEYYKHIMCKYDEEKLELQTGIEPFKKDNARLFKENNNLIEQINVLKEKLDCETRQHKTIVRKLNNELEDLNFAYKHSLNKIREVQKESVDKSNRLLQLTSGKTVVVNTGGKKKFRTLTQPLIEVIEPLTNHLRQAPDTYWSAQAQADDLHIVNMAEIMDRKICSLAKQIDLLTCENAKHLEIIDKLKCQINQRDKEIERLRINLGEGRPLSVLTRNCCCSCTDKEKKIQILEYKLQESTEKQHDAMTRAVHLAERNKKLEREFKDIDRLALAVQEECNEEVRDMKKKLDQKIKEIKELEISLTEMKNQLDIEVKNVEMLRKDKCLMEESIKSMHMDKKTLNEKINKYSMIEKDLAAEIDRLHCKNLALQNQVRDLEMQCSQMGIYQRCQCKCGGDRKKGLLSPQHKHPRKPSNNFPSGPSIVLLEKLQSERDFFQNECQRLQEQLNRMPHHSKTPPSHDYNRKLSEKEESIYQLEQRIRVLQEENHKLKRRLDGSPSKNCCEDNYWRNSMERLEHDVDIKNGELKKLHQECEMLRERLKVAQDSQASEHVRMERIIMDNEERIRQLENERRDFLNSQGSNRGYMRNLEEKCDALRQELRTKEAELGQINTLYNQLKNLQESSDRALAETQNHLSQVECELTRTRNTFNELDKNRKEKDDHISCLNKEIMNLKDNIVQSEKEKDSYMFMLDDKTEKLVELESEIKRRDACLQKLLDKVGLNHFNRGDSSRHRHPDPYTNLETMIDALLQRIATLEQENQKIIDRKNGMVEAMISDLQRQLTETQHAKDCAVAENSRFQNDLAILTRDLYQTRSELEQKIEAVETLKLQLQQYCTEVKKVEECLSEKERERTELLDHFRCLSEEATHLSTNNHSLESDMDKLQNKYDALEKKFCEVENGLEAKNCLVASYEQQICELSAHVAELESKLTEQSELRKSAEADAAVLRDLCSTLGNQNEKIRRDSQNLSDGSLQMSNEVRRLSEEVDTLKYELDHEKSVCESLKQNLSETRNETIQEKINNTELIERVKALEHKVVDLTSKLKSESSKRKECEIRYQTQCDKSSREVNDLRLELANYKYEKAKSQG